METIPVEVVYLNVPLKERERIDKLMLTNISQNPKEDLKLIEDTILQLCDHSQYEEYAHPAISYLMDVRKQLLDAMLIVDEATCEKMKLINTILAEQGVKVVDKMKLIYQQWLETKGTGWDHTCNVAGKICFKFMDEPPMDDSGSRFDEIFPILSQLSTPYLWSLGFSNPADICDWTWRNLYKSVGYSTLKKRNPFGDWKFCEVFNLLYMQFSVQDILRIESFWGSAILEHQNIVYSNGKVF